MHIKLPTLKFRHMRGDMIEVFKLTHNIYDESISPQLSFCTRSNTRGNSYKLLNHTFHYDLRKHFLQHVLLIYGTVCQLRFCMLALLMHLKHAYISFGCTSKLCLILLLILVELETDQYCHKV